MIRSLALTISIGSVLATCGLAFAQEDLSKAREMYTACKEKLDAGAACDALPLCEEGRKASDTKALADLTIDAKAACDKEKAKAAEAAKAKKEKEEKAKKASDEVAASGAKATGDATADRADTKKTKKKKKKTAAKIKPGRISAVGAIDKKDIKRIVARNKSKIARCYEAALQSDPSLEGKIVLTWTVGSTGSVLAAAVKSDTIGSAKVSSCLVRVVKRWKFPPPATGGVVKINYPFAFSPG